MHTPTAQHVSDPLDVVLEKLNAGDIAAAEQVFRSFEPYLRMVVRRTLPPRLRSRFDSLDVVQSVWSDLWPGFRSGRWRFSGTAQLKTFLVRATRNRLIDGLRKHGPEVQRQRSMTEGTEAWFAETIGPEEVLEADELWQRMLTLCPRRHHDLLRLRRQGYTIEQIAHQTGLHEGSVRRILYELARQLVVPAS